MQSNIHIKVQYNHEFRRFVLAEVDYNNLVDTVRSLLSFDPETVLKLSYLDDEGDWVFFATDSELQHAIAISKSPLKICIKCSGDSTPISEGSCTFNSTMDKASTAQEPWTWRGGRGRRGGRGGGRGGRGGDWKAEKCERIDAKVARLTDRHVALTAKLVEDDLPQEKARALEWRLTHLQKKIDSLKAKKEMVEKEPHDHDEASKGFPETEEDQCPHQRYHQRHHQRGGGWRRGGRGCRFGGEGPHHPPHFGGEGPHHPPHFGGEWPHSPHFPHAPHHHPRGGCHLYKGGKGGECEGKPTFVAACSTPEGKAAFDRLHAAKEAVVNARREKAEKEVIKGKLNELKEAKAAWREIKLALWHEQKGQECVTSPTLQDK